jgi:RNA polymerase sigma-70 factor (ECF subfamily)
MTNALSSPDLLLARRAAAGQAAAWDELLGLYAQRIYNLALHFTGSPTDAEDLTQEIFLRLYQSLRLYRGDVPLAAWALRLSRNLCIDSYRKVRRERRFAVVSEDALRWHPSADDPQAEAQGREQLRAVHEALAEMPEDLAEVVVLRDLQGWSQEEAAAFLEVPVGTVKSRLHRARLELGRRVTARLGVVPVPGATPGKTVPALEVGSC